MDDADQPKRRGLLIVVEGLDRAGKTSQCQLLLEALKRRGHQVKYIKFPDRNTPTGKMINSYLQGQAQLDDHSVHLLFSANRWEAAQGVLSDLSGGTNIIVDRYSYSGAVYSAAKENPGLSLEWAWHPECGLPRPDLLLFLSVSSEVAAGRGGYGEERYETDTMQNKVRRLFEFLLSMDHDHEIRVIDASSSIEEVAQKLLSSTVTLLSTSQHPNAPTKIRSWQELLNSLDSNSRSPGLK